jgi:hypothetical protein
MISGQKTAASALAIDAASNRKNTARGGKFPPRRKAGKAGKFSDPMALSGALPRGKASAI